MAENDPLATNPTTAPGETATPKKGTPAFVKAAGAVIVVGALVGAFLVKRHFAAVNSATKMTMVKPPAPPKQDVASVTSSKNIIYRKSIDKLNEQQSKKALQSGGVYIPVTGGMHDTVGDMQARGKYPPIRSAGPNTPQGPSPADVEIQDKYNELKSLAVPIYADTPQVTGMTVDYIEPAAAVPAGGKNGSSSASGAGKEKSPKIPSAHIPPGTIWFGVLINGLDSDHPGPVLAQLVEGPYRGDKMVGHFTRDKSRLAIQFDELTLKDGTPVTIQAFAVKPDKSLSNGLATSVNHHYLYRYGMLLGSGFLQGFGGAAVMNGANVTMTPYGSPMEMFSGQNTMANAMYGIGTAAQAMQSVAQNAFNTPPTVKVAPNTPVGVFFTGSDIKVPASKSSPTLFAQQTQQPGVPGVPGAPGYPGVTSPMMPAMPMASMPMMPMMP